MRIGRSTLGDTSYVQGHVLRMARELHSTLCGAFHVKWFHARSPLSLSHNFDEGGLVAVPCVARPCASPAA
jgi:hypothetical protein